MEFTLSVTEEEIKVLSIALSELPYKMSSNLINKLQLQINEQINKPAIEEE